MPKPRIDIKAVISQTQAGAEDHHSQNKLHDNLQFYVFGCFYTTVLQSKANSNVQIRLILLFFPVKSSSSSEQRHHGCYLEITDHRNNTANGEKHVIIKQNMIRLI